METRERKDSDIAISIIEGEAMLKALGIETHLLTHATITFDMGAPLKVTCEYVRTVKDVNNLMSAINSPKE